MVEAIAMNVDNAVSNCSSLHKSSSCSNLQVMQSSTVINNRTPSASDILTAMSSRLKKIFNIKKPKSSNKRAKIEPLNFILTKDTQICNPPPQNSMPVIVISESVSEPNSPGSNNLDSDSISVSSAVDAIEIDGEQSSESPDSSNTNLAVIPMPDSSVVQYETENNSIIPLTSEELVKYQDIPSQELDVLKQEVMRLVDQRYHTKFYDFCLICCEEDYEEAENFKFNIMRQFNLQGCMLEDDNMTLGRDTFDAYEYMMDRSTKVMFYITENFNEDRFCRRLQNGAVFQTLMSRIKREKCVPLFPRGLCDIPLALSGILGIETRLERQLKSRLNCTYSDEVREFRTVRELQFEELRQRYFKELLSQKVEEYRQRIAVCENTDNTNVTVEEPEITEAVPGSTSTSSKVNTNTNSNTHNSSNCNDTNLGGLENVLHSVGVDREGVDRVVQSILDACTRERNVTVTNSSNVRIGNQIDVTVVVGASNIQESYSERSASDDSEHSDSEESSSDNSENESAD